MKFLIISILTFIFSSQLLASSKSCPMDKGETTNSCEMEQMQVEEAMQGLKVAKQYNYCRTPSADRPDGVGLQCRTLTLYTDKSGKITRDFFKFQFMAAEVHRSLFFDIFYVKNDDGTYDSFHDEVADGILKIDNQKEDWRGVTVNFDKNHFPSYETVFITPSGDPSKPPKTNLASTKYSHFDVILVDNPDKPVEEQSTIIYGVVGPVQVPKK